MTTTRRNFLGIAAALGCAGAAPDREDSEFTMRIFAKINELRVARSAPPLVWSRELAACAYEQSRRKALLGFPGHDDPERGDVAARLTAAGLKWSACAENLFMEKGWDDPANLAVVFWWYSTSGHQENLLNPRYTQSAIGVFKAGDGAFFVTQIFMTPRVVRQ